MRKFYTFTAAAIFAISAFAAQPFGLKRAPKDLTLSRISENSAVVKLDAKGAKVASGDFASAPTQAATESLENSYYETSYSIRRGSSGGAVGWQSDGLVEVEQQADGKYTIYDFWDTDCTISDGVYDAAAGTLTFKSQVMATGFSNNYSARLTLYDFSTGSPTDGDIVFKYSPSDRSITYEGENDGTSYTKILGVAAYDASGNYVGGFDYLLMVCLDMVNGVSTYSYKDSEGTKQTSGVYVYNELVNGDLVTYNLFDVGFTNGVTFKLDVPNKTAKTEDAVVAVLKDNSDNRYEVKLYNFTEGNIQNTLGDTNVTYTMSLKVDEDDYTTTEIKAPYVACGTFLSSDNWYPIEGTGYFYDFTVEYDGDLLSSTGINKVTKDDNENAPVEYYNLQGVKVASPENGIFIKKQGSKATKVIF